MRFQPVAPANVTLNLDKPIPVGTAAEDQQAATAELERKRAIEMYATCWKDMCAHCTDPWAIITCVCFPLESRTCKNLRVNTRRLTIRLAPVPISFPCAYLSRVVLDADSNVQRLLVETLDELKKLRPDFVTAMHRCTRCLKLWGAGPMVLRG